MSNFIPMLSSSPPPIDDGGNDDWGEDGFGGFQDASSTQNDFGEFATFNSVQEDSEELSTTGKSSGVKETLPDNDCKLNGNISERIICDQESNIPQAVASGTSPRGGHNRVSSDEGFADFQSVPKPASCDDDSNTSRSHNGNGSQDADSDGKNDPPHSACDNSSVSQPAGALSCEAQTVDNTSQDSVTDSGLCSDMSPGAKCEDYPEFPNQKDSSQVVSPQGSSYCAHTESTSENSLSVEKKISSEDDLPSESRSNIESLTCSGESNSVVEGEMKEDSNTDSESGACNSVKLACSSNNHDSSEEDKVNCENVNSVDESEGDKDCQQSNSTHSDAVEGTAESERCLENDCQVVKENSGDNPNNKSSIPDTPETNNRVDSQLKGDNGTPEVSDKESVKTNESDDEANVKEDTSGKSEENQDSPEDEFGTFDSFRNTSELNLRQSISEDFDDFQEAEDGDTSLAKTADDNEDGNGLTFRTETGE